MPSSPQWIFDRFRLDPDHACLWRGEQALALPPKAFDVLHYLVTHPDRLVTKDELLDAVWPDTAISDAVVRVAIGALRKVLSDTAQTPRFIATVHRRGYRFLAPVALHTEIAPRPAELVPPAAPQPPPPTTPEARPESRVAPGGETLLPEAERRPLKVLFCNLGDATTLAGHLDPEDILEIVRAYHRTCAAVIRRFDGYLAQYLGSSGRWSSRGRIRNGATKPMPCVSSARLQRNALRLRASMPKRTTSKRSPWPRRWAYARFRPTATSARPWRPVSSAGTGRRGARRAIYRHGAVPYYGDNLLAAPGRGGVGASTSSTGEGVKRPWNSSAVERLAAMRCTRHSVPG